MRRPAANHPAASGTSLAKAPSGIAGLDEITGGGLPRGRASLVCGGPGCGKTLFGTEFLVRGATQFGEPGVFMSFEETAEELAQNVASLGFDLEKLQSDKLIAIDHVRVERSDIEEAGEFDLEGLFVRLDMAIRSVGAKRVVLDTLESLFSGLPNPAILRSEIRRLFRWLKDRQLTVVITAEQGSGTLTREGLEEYVSDCVIFLDHRVMQQTSTRRLRVVKYRGTLHGTNEYPFLIDETGISILPITSLRLAHHASKERVSSGIQRLDEMLGGEGYLKGSTILVSGTAGAGKTTVAAALVRAACARGERCLYFAYEESPEQLARNMQSVGIELAPYIRNGRLSVFATRPVSHGLEMHLVALHKAVRDHDPAVVVVDPITNLTGAGTPFDAISMVTRVIDFLKSRGVTTLLTALTRGGENVEETELGVSSIVDTWILLSIVRSGGERNRTLSIIKSRGMSHSNQFSEFVLSDKGLALRDAYTGPSGVLTGSARLVQEARDRSDAVAAAEAIERKRQLRERRRAVVESQITALREQLASDEADLDRAMAEDQQRVEQFTALQTALSQSRYQFSGSDGGAAAKERRR